MQVRLAPVGPREAAAMLRELRTFPLLDGFRGAPRADVGAVENIVERVAALAAAHPEIAELDCNPVVAGPDGAVIVDARIRLAPAPARPPVGALNRSTVAGCGELRGQRRTGSGWISASIPLY